MTITGDLAQWLHDLGLSCYEQNFREQGYELDSIKAMGLKEDDFVALQITKRGHINKINLSLAKQRSPVAALGFDRNGTLNELLHLTRKELSSSGLNESNCWQLVELTDKISLDITSLIWNYIDKNCRNAVNSSQFLSISEETLLAFLQRETIEIKEAELFLAVTKWLNANHPSRQDQIFSRIRFGLFSAEELLLAEKINVPGVKYLYHSWRKLADKRAVNLGDTVANYFSLRIGQVQFVEKPAVQPAPGVEYEVSLSSTYETIMGASYASLTNDHYNHPGAATGLGPNQWIQAKFESPVTVTKVSVGAPTKGQFEEEGWDGEYTGGAMIQYSEDGANWKDSTVIASLNPTGLTDIVLPQPTTAPFWRLFKAENCWLATGSLIFS